MKDTNNLADFFENWTVQVRKGVLEYCILNALRREERYGYELVKSLVSIPGLEVAEGTIYPLLSRLRLKGFVSTRLVESTEGPARKYYAITKAGEETLDLMNDYFEGLVGATRGLSDAGQEAKRNKN